MLSFELSLKKCVQGGAKDDSGMAENLMATATRLKQAQKVSRGVQALVLGKEPSGFWKNVLHFTSLG